MGLLEVRNLTKSFGGLMAVSNVIFEVGKGQIKAIIGPNGAGKSTIFKLIAGIHHPDSGEVRFKGEPITGLRPYQIASMGLLWTFQKARPLVGMTVLENVMVGRHVRTKSEIMSAIMRLPRARVEEASISKQAWEILGFVGLAEKASMRADSLPMAQQKYLEVARALAAEPELILLDEPAAGLNTYEIDELAEVIHKIREQGITILLVEHQMGLVMNISDEVMVLDFGKKIAEGTPHEVQNNPEVISAYLGGEARPHA